MAKTIPTRESVQALIGPRAPVLLIRPFQYEVKPTKFEPRSLLLTNYRLYLLLVKTPPKVESSFNLLEISGLESSGPGKLLLILDSSKKISLQNSPEENSVDDVVFLIFELLWNTFPDVPLERIVSKVEVSPPTRWKEILDRLESVKRPSGLCGNFSRSYGFFCDRMSLPHQEDVAWDVETIYHAHKTTELTLCDFEYLEPRLYASIVASLRHGQYFSGLNLSGIKLGSDCLQEVLELMKFNSYVKDLSLSNTGIKHDFIQKLVAALSSNKSSELISLDLSSNVLEEKGILNLCSAASITGRLTGLNISGCNVTARALTRLVDSCFAQNKQLVSLDVSDNCLKDELLSLQKNIICQSNSLTCLKLAGTECPVEVIMNGLSQGCSQTLVHLDLSRNPFKKSARDSSNISSAWRQFFGAAAAVRSINLSSTKIHPEALRQIFQGLASNSKVSSLELNVSSNALGQNGAIVLESVIPEVHNIASLDLSENGFDQSLSNVAAAFAQSNGYRKVALGKNFTSAKIKNVIKILDSVALLLQVEKTTIESLAFDELRIRSDMTIILNALGTNTFLTELDISGNQMGDNGANLLGKALQVNNRLATVFWDCNGTTATGFGYIATALVKNFTLKRMPTPVVDVAAALRGNQEKVLQALKKIDAILLRNQDPKSYSAEPSYRLQQSFLTGTSQQDLDRLVSQIEDVTRHLRQFDLTDSEKEEVDGATKLVKEEQSISSIFMELHKLSSALTSPDGAFYAKLKSFQTEIHGVIGKQVQNSLDESMKLLESMFPSILKTQPFTSELRTACSEQCSPPDGFLRELIVDRLGAEITRKMLDLQLVAITQIVTFAVEELQRKLHSKLTSLTNICSAHQSGISRNPSVMSRANILSKETKNKVGTVRQTLHARMLRPKSTMFEGSDRIDSIPDEVFEDGFPSSSSSTSSPSRMNSEGVQPPSSSELASSNSLKDDGKMSSSVDDLSDLPVSPPLKNLRWNRPRREKNHAAMSINGVCDQQEEGSDDDDDNGSVKSFGSDGRSQTQQQNGFHNSNNNNNNNGLKESDSSKVKANVVAAKPTAGPVPAKPSNGKPDIISRKTIHPPRSAQARYSPGNSAGEATNPPKALPKPPKRDRSVNSDLEDKSTRTSKDSEEGASADESSRLKSPDGAESGAKGK